MAYLCVLGAREGPLPGCRHAGGYESGMLSTVAGTADLAPVADGHPDPEPSHPAQQGMKANFSKHVVSRPYISLHGLYGCVAFQH